MSEAQVAADTPVPASGAGEAFEPAPLPRAAAPAAADAPPPWVPSVLLTKPEAAPRFLRAAWDAQRAHEFGRWRVAPATDPAVPLEQQPVPATPHLPAPAAEAVTQDPAATEPGIPAEAAPLLSAGLSDEQIAQIQAEAYARGVAEGQAQARAEMQAERARESELLRHLGIEMRALHESPERFFEPLRRLSLHLAEQLVRAELRLSGEAISQIVRQALQALDHPGPKVIIQVHPDDAALLQELAPDFLKDLKLQSDPDLHRGSVRLRLDDTLLEDLIDHRLQALAERLLADPAPRESGASALMRETTRAEPVADNPASPLRRRRAAGMDDVIDATAIPVPDVDRSADRSSDAAPPTDAPSHPSDPQDPSGGAAS